MTAITVPLSEETLARLTAVAKQAGQTPEEMLSASLEQWLANPADDFAKAAEYVLKKNTELYRRLA